MLLLLLFFHKVEQEDRMINCNVMKTMRHISKWFFFMIFIFTYLQVSPGYSVDNIPAASPNNKLLCVGVIPLEPFAMNQDGKPMGISIELWEEIAKIYGWQYKYTFVPQSGYLDIEPLLLENKLDVVIGPIAITY